MLILAVIFGNQITAPTYLKGNTMTAPVGSGDKETGGEKPVASGKAVQDFDIHGIAHMSDEELENLNTLAVELDGINYIVTPMLVMRNDDGGWVEIQGVNGYDFSNFFSNFRLIFRKL